MKTPLAPKLTLARTVGTLSRLRGGGGTSAPGKALLRLDRTAIGTLAGRLPRGTALISATNGKTTTAAFAATIFRHAAIPLVHNDAGANMAGGIASTLLAASRPRGGIAGELGLFEVDEFWLDSLSVQLRPRAILLGNLFRDQLDRYGELESIAARWALALERLTPGGSPSQSATQPRQDDTPSQQDATSLRQDAPPPHRHSTRLVLNADDPLIADLGREHADVLYFGVEDDSLALPGLAHAADAKHCRRCGAPYVFDAVYLGHLGHYRCTACGQQRPTPTVVASDVILEGVRAARFTLRTPAGSGIVELALPGLYNVYNALAAAALATALEVPFASIIAGLQATRAAFGRAESVTVAGRELRILLIKNPAGANEVLRTLALQPGQHDILGVLNDNIADGRDISWIWDADFELLAERVHHATCAGTRAAELALRLKYAGIPPARLSVCERLGDALTLAAGDGAHRPTPPPPLYALPTYTAMLALREQLHARGAISGGAWQ
jgi:UDP-N-acetylmuramyl tripeptide synthase